MVGSGTDKVGGGRALANEITKKNCLAHNNFEATQVAVVVVGREIKGVGRVGATMAEGGEHVIISVL